MYTEVYCDSRLQIIITDSFASNIDDSTHDTCTSVLIFETAVRLFEAHYVTMIHGQRDQRGQCDLFDRKPEMQHRTPEGHLAAPAALAQELAPCRHFQNSVRHPPISELLLGSAAHPGRTVHQGRSHLLLHHCQKRAPLCLLSEMICRHPHHLRT